MARDKRDAPWGLGVGSIATDHGCNAGLPGGAQGGAEGRVGLPDPPSLASVHERPTCSALQSAERAVDSPDPAKSTAL